MNNSNNNQNNKSLKRSLPKYLLTLGLLGALGLNVNWQNESARQAEAGFVQLASSGDSDVFYRKGSEGAYTVKVGDEQYKLTVKDRNGETIASVTEAKICVGCEIQEMNIDVNVGSVPLDDVDSIFKAALADVRKITGHQKIAKVEKIQKKEKQCSDLTDLDKSLECGVKKCLKLAKDTKRKRGASKTVLNCYEDEMSDALSEIWAQIRDDDYDTESVKEFREDIEELIEDFDQKSASKVRKKLARVWAKSARDPNVDSLKQTLSEINPHRRSALFAEFNKRFGTDQLLFDSLLRGSLINGKRLGGGLYDKGLLDSSFGDVLYKNDFYCPVMIDHAAKVTYLPQGHYSYCNDYISSVETQSAGDVVSSVNGRSTGDRQLGRPSVENFGNTAVGNGSSNLPILGRPEGTSVRGFH